ncbi:MAG: hypothetical protein LBQ52_00625 [Helicobacteraceae bacterium]|jgi:hypothetical protein|nr:hypothetical protein [Helicobacteraceae bacterium]
MYAFSHNADLPIDDSAVSYLSAMKIAFDPHEVCDESIGFACAQSFADSNDERENCEQSA